VLLAVKPAPKVNEVIDINRGEIIDGNNKAIELRTRLITVSATMVLIALSFLMTLALKKKLTDPPMLLKVRAKPTAQIGHKVLIKTGVN